MTPFGPERLSHVIGRMLRESEGAVTIGQTLDALDQRSFGGVMIVLALPAMLLPPGVSLLLAAPSLLVSIQLLTSQRRPWLPAGLRGRGLRRVHAERVFDKAEPILRSTEGWVRPRLQILICPVHDRLIGVSAAMMSVMLMLPLPIAHTAAGLSIGAFGVGLMERDGLALIAGWFLSLTALALAVAFLLGAAAWLSHI